MTKALGVSPTLQRKHTHTCACVRPFTVPTSTSQPQIPAINHLKFTDFSRFPGLWIASLSFILLIFISLQSNFDVNACHLPFHKRVKCPSFEAQWHPKETLLRQLITNCIPLQFASILDICLPCCATENLERKGYIPLQISVVQKVRIIISGRNYLRIDNS